MSDTKISDLTAADPPVGDELVPVVQAGATVQTTVADIVASAPIRVSVGEMNPTSGSGVWPRRQRQTIVDGDTPGDVAVTGIDANDILESVLDLTDQVDLTAEFLPAWLGGMPSDGIINNTGGTDTTGNKLLVTWTGGTRLGGMAFDDTIQEATAVTKMVPASWVETDVYAALISMGSGNARIRANAAGSGEVDQTVAFASPFSFHKVKILEGIGIDADGPFYVQSGEITGIGFFRFDRVAGDVLDTLTDDLIVYYFEFVPAA